MRTILFLCALLISSVSHAQFYGIVEAGAGKVSDTTATLATIFPGATLSQDNSVPVLKLGGGYSLNKHLAFEVSYTNTGVVTTRGYQEQGSDKASGNLQERASGFEYAAVIKPSDRWFFKVGAHRMTVKSNIQIVETMTHESEKIVFLYENNERTTGTGLLYGVGYEFDFGKNAIRVGFTQYNDIGNLSEVDAKLYSVAYKVNF